VRQPPAVERLEAGAALRNALFAPYVPVVPSVGRWAPRALPVALAADAEQPWAAGFVDAVAAHVGRDRTVWRAVFGAGPPVWEFTWFRAGADLPVAAVASALASVGAGGLEVPDHRALSGFAVQLGPSGGAAVPRLRAVHALAGSAVDAADPSLRHRLDGGSAGIVEVLTPWVPAPFGDALRARMADSFQFDRRARIEQLWWEPFDDATVAALGHLSGMDRLYLIGLRLGPCLEVLSRAGVAARPAGLLERHRGDVEHLRFDLSLGYRFEGGVPRVLEVGLMGVL
jgi:hypothetical protein